MERGTLDSQVSLFSHLEPRVERSMPKASSRWNADFC